MEEHLSNNPGFWEKLQKNMWGQVAFFIGCMALLLAIYIPTNASIGWNVLLEWVGNLPKMKEYNIVSSVEKVRIKDGQYTITGWVLSEKSRNNKIVISLVGDDGTEIILKTKETKREDISSMYNAQWDYGEVGFEAKINEDKLQKDVCYQICVSLDYVVERTVENKAYWVKERTKVETERYLYNQEIFRYNPTSFYAPMVTDTEFVDAIEQGTLYVFDQEQSAWIYEYNNYLYYIVPSDLLGNIENKPEIALYAFTTRPEKLAKEMEEYGREYIYYFPSSSDINLANETGYLLYKMPFSPNYPITYIDTGIYFNNDKEWKWKVTFRYN